ncbi:MAG: DUF116 domain-containing protein [Planctomycetes bacterium]|nr:DUF116 domain-containing protein [Planctomycetota bacterium]
MIILAKLSSDQWIGIYTLVAATLVGITGNIIAYFQYKKANRLPLRHDIRQPIDKWKRNSLCVRIFLHRLAAIATITFVLLSVRKTSANFVLYLLWGVLIFEVLWLFKHLNINPTSKHKGKRSGWAFIIPHWIENHIDLKYKGSEYPTIPLLIELLALTYLCVVSGGLRSPFFSLFAMFCLLALYISYSIQPIRSAIYVISFSFCFLLISSLGDYEFTLGGVNHPIPENYRMTIASEDELLFTIMYAWATVTCALLFLGITSYFAKIGQEQLNAPVERTKDILASRNRQYKLVDNLSVFRIGDNNTFNPKTTLALLPYCSRGPRCQIRRDNEKLAIDIPISGDQCDRCKPLCSVGKLINYENIAEIKVIGSHHGIDEAIEEFLIKHNHQLTHIIAVCCTSRLAKYLSRIDDPKLKAFNITVIYTPLLSGIDTCLSSTDIMHNGRTASVLPLTSFNAASLINSLEMMVENDKKTPLIERSQNIMNRVSRIVEIPKSSQSRCDYRERKVKKDSP